MPEPPEPSNHGDGDAIKVFMRVRPPALNLAEADNSKCLEVDSENNLLRMHSKPDAKVFTFDQVADENTTQESVFAAVGKKTIQSSVAGYNGTIFAYGQTGSGKTFTMIGPSGNMDNFQHKMRGVIPRSFEYLFNLIKEQQEQFGEDVQFLCKCSFLEIYNEQVFDLLDPGSTGLQIRENMKRGVFVDGIIEQSVLDATEAYQCLTSGWMNRTVASTSMNRESSRSHAVFTVHIESKKNKGGVWNVRSSQLNLVDLAGSERQKDTKTDGLRLKEAGRINQSLSTLGNVMMALVHIERGKTRYVPYRDSKLSFLLKDSLGGNTKTYIIGCVHPGARCFGETLSTLQFAQRAKMIKNKAVVNEDLHGSALHLQAEIRKLREIVAQYESGAIPMEPSIGDTGEVVSSDGVMFKQYFIQAMYFRRCSLDEKKVVHEKYKRLQEMCNRKEHSLRQNKMILKFREDALKKYENAHKESADLSPDDQTDIIASLRQEIKILQDKLNNNPEAKYYKLENANLQAEIKKIQYDKTFQDVDSKQSAELYKVYQLLVADDKEQVGDRCVSMGSPQKGSGPCVNSSATVERHKTHISKLQSEVETLRRELAAEHEESQRLVVEKESEIVSLRKAKEELEKNMAAHRVRYQVEKEAMEDTMMTITTPKKARYLLRNRTIMIPGSGRPGTEPMMSLAGGDSNDSYSEPQEETISQQSLPEGYLEDQIDNLLEQLKKLQEENRFVHAQRDNLESQVVQQVEEVSRVESQKQLTEKLYSREKAAWANTQQELNTQVKRLTDELQGFVEERIVLSGEVHDLRIMYSGVEKRCKEACDKEKRCKDSKEKEVGALETKTIQMQVELTRIQRELEQLQEEQVILTESEENCQATLDFTQDKLNQAEESLVQANKANLELQGKLITAEERLSQEAVKSGQLCAQLNQRGDDQEKKLSESLMESGRLHDLLESTKLEMTAVKTELTSAAQQIERLEETDSERRDMIPSLMSQLSSKKDVILEKEHHIETLEKQHEEYRQANDDLITQNDLVNQQKTSLKSQHDEQIYSLQNQIHKLQVQVEMQQEDVDQMMEEKDDLMSNLTKLNTVNSNLTNTNDQLTKTIKDMEDENQSLSNKLTELKQSLECVSAEKDEVREKEREVDFWQAKCDEQQRRYTEILDAFDTVSGQQAVDSHRIKSLEEQANTKKRQISELEIELERVGQDRIKCDDNNKNLSDSVEQLESLVAEKEAEITSIRELLKAKEGQSEQIQLLCREISSHNQVLKQEGEELRERCQQEAEEKAHLAGNQNHAERIKYVERINQERHEVNQKYQQLLVDYNKLKAKVEKGTLPM